MIVYRGPSAIDGREIVVILTGLQTRRGSKNAKTGELIQSWILRADVEPHTRGENRRRCVGLRTVSASSFAG
jgi:hypothetical protein